MFRDADRRKKVLLLFIQVLRQVADEVTPHLLQCRSDARLVHIILPGQRDRFFECPRLAQEDLGVVMGRPHGSADFVGCHDSLHRVEEG